MADEHGHELYLTAQFAARFAEIENAVLNGDQSAEPIYEHLVESMASLADGSDDGHHPLTDMSWRGQGDLRDCTASEFATDPSFKRGDFRIVWRQLPSQREGGRPIRELVLARSRPLAEREFGIRGGGTSENGHAATRGR